MPPTTYAVIETRLVIFLPPAPSAVVVLIILQAFESGLHLGAQIGLIHVAVDASSR